VDVQFLLRKGKKIHGEHLVFVVFPQYQNRKYHQLSIQIPVKVDKRATMRNLFKRTALDVGRKILEEKKLPTFLKVFVFVNKQGV
jgi:ribonuclease P protein component